MRKNDGAYDIFRQGLDELVASRLAEFGKTKHWLSVESGVAGSSVNRFLNGESDMCSEGVRMIFSVLGLEVRPIEGFSVDDGAGG